MRAATVGESPPGRTATRVRKRSVDAATAEAMTNGSSQERPVGMSTP